MPRQKSRPFLAVVLALPMLAGWSAGEARAQDAGQDSALLENLRHATDALKRGDRRGFENARNDIRDHHARILLEYLTLEAQGEQASLASLQHFLRSQDTHPDLFPNIARIRRHGEAALARSNPSAQQVLAHFHGHPPVSGIGARLLGEAHMARGARQRGAEMLRQAWREHVAFAPEHSGDFGMRDFLHHHAALLTRDDHIARLDALLWNEEMTVAERMPPLLSATQLPAAQRALARARLRLMRRAPGVDAAVAAVPAHLREDPGLVYERVRWRRLQGLEDAAIELLLLLPPPTQQAEKWWRERHVLARYALQEGRYRDAYRLARAHGLESGVGFAEGEFLAGWLALRFLDDPLRAHGHFGRLRDGVRTPISLARALYWLGRAADEIGAGSEAQEHWLAAAGFDGTYYGQLARERLTQEQREQLAREIAAQNAHNAQDRRIREESVVSIAFAPEGTETPYFASGTGREQNSPPGAGFLRAIQAFYGVDDEGADAVASAGEGAGEARDEIDGDEIDGDEIGDVLRFVALAYGIGYEELGEALLLRHARQAEERRDFVLLSEAALRLGRKHLALRIAKRAARRHFFLGDVLYPLDAFPLHALRAENRTVSPALLLAVARQESEFDVRAVSSAGARGLMQLLPSTAKQVAVKHGLAYEREALLRDAGYNVHLGELYLGEMLARFDGSVVLTVAAYNAGPGRVAGWLRESCGAGLAGCEEFERDDWIDWIEAIPFGETRNYVQRVLENRNNYRRILGHDRG